MSTQDDLSPDLHRTEQPRRPVRVAHLVFGVVFLGLAGLWALATGGVVDTQTTSYLMPGLLVLAGAAGLVGSLASGRTRTRPAATHVVVTPAESLTDSTTERAADSATGSTDETTVIPTDPETDADTTDPETDPEEGSR